LYIKLERNSLKDHHSFCTIFIPLGASVELFDEVEKPYPDDGHNINVLPPFFYSIFFRKQYSHLFEMMTALFLFV